MTRSTVRISLFAVLASLLLPMAAWGHTVGPEWWIGGGFTKSDYHDYQLALGRAGVGLVFDERFALGTNAQVDGKHWFWTAYACVVLPAIGPVEPYGRFHVGRRDDLKDTALGWTGGFRTGPAVVKLFVEAHGIVTPGYGTGASIGLFF